MTDFLGKEVNLGDQVVFMLVGYRHLKKGTITKMSPKKCTIKYAPGEYAWTMQRYDQIVKV
jgi:hypothetical protein